MPTHLTDFFRLVLEASWQCSLIILLVLLVRPLMGASVPARWRYLLWTLVLVRLLVPISVFPSNPVSMQNIAVVGRPFDQVPFVLPAAQPPEPPPVLGQQEPGPMASPAAFVAQPAPSSHFPIPWWTVAAGIWLTGMLISTGTLISAQILLWRRLGKNRVPVDAVAAAAWEKCCHRLRIKHRPVLRRSSGVASPALVGLIRPVLLLPDTTPATFSPEDWENIFVHELAHYRRADHWVHAVQLAALSVHWFNPVVWLGFRQLRADRELAADEWALRHLDPDRSTAYGDTLLKILTGSSGNTFSAASVGILEDRLQLKHRLQRIVGFGPRRFVGSLAGIAVLAIIGAVTLTGASVSKPADAPATVALPPQEVVIQSIVKDDASLAAQALKDGAQLNPEVEYIHNGFIDKNTPLYFAAEKGELDLVRLFVEHGASVKPGKSTWTNPLDAALRNGHAAVATYLHDHGATCDPLVYAAGTGDLEALTRATAAGKPKSLDEAASAAAGCGQVAAMNALLGTGANAKKAFQRAAATGSIASLQELLGHGVDIKTAGYDALGHAAYNDRTEATAFLLKAGATPNRQKQPTDTRFTEIDPPLNQAAKVGAAGSAKLLLEAGADPNSIVVTDPGYGGAGNTPLCDACSPDSDEIVRLLLDHGAGLEIATSGGFTPALYAAYSHAPRCLALLLDRGANIKAYNPKWKCGIIDFAVIFNGEDANRQDFEIPTKERLNQCMATVQVLLDHGVDINGTTRDGLSLLSASIMNGQTAWTETLLRRGAKLNVIEGGGTPLISAINSMGFVKEKRYYEVLNELLARGADPNLAIDDPGAQKKGATSALTATMDGPGTWEMRRKTVELLLAHGARFEVPKDSDAGKMLLAATSGDAASVTQLLAKGVSPNAADAKGWTPLLSAAAMGYEAIFKTLVDAGANVNAHDANGLNALWLVMQNYPDLTDFHLLLDKGADINADSTFMFYDPPIYMAINQHDPALLADLLKRGASPNMLPGDHPSRFEPLELAVNDLMEKFDDQKRRDVVTLLIKAGANRNPKQDGYRCSLLFFSMANNMMDMTKFLLDAGIDPKKDADGGKGLSDELERHGSKEMKGLVGPLLAPKSKPAQ